MGILSRIGALQDIELRAECGIQFTFRAKTYDFTGCTAVMHISYGGDGVTVPPVMHQIVLEVLDPIRLYCDIPPSIAQLLPRKSRQLTLITKPEGGAPWPLCYGTIATLREPP